MIDKNESGLSESAYAAMSTGTDPSFKVEIQQYNLSLSSKPGGGTAGAVSTLSTSSSSSMLVRAWTYSNTVYVEALANEDSSDQSWAEQSFNPTNLKDSSGCSVIVDGTTIRVFYFADGSIRYRESSGGAAFGEENKVGSAGSVIGLAAVSLTRVHYIELTSKSNYRFCVYEDVGGWAKTESSVYWPFRPTSFDAVNASPTDDEATSDTDVIAISTDFPPIISVKAEGTTLVKDVERVQGIAILRYQNGRWSDEYKFDIVDNVQTYPSRHGVRLSKYSDWIFMTYMRTDGFGTYTTTTIATTRSKDGIAWEIPYLLTDNLDGPCCLEKMGKYAYLLDSVGTYRSLSSAYTGDARNTYDVSDYVLDVNIRSVEVSEVQITLSNQSGVLDLTSPFGDDAVLQAVVELGFMVDGVSQKLQVTLADIEIMSTVKVGPQQNTVIIGRDYLGRLTSFNSDYSQEWETQSIGGDDFEGVVADTIYSGMGHTAPIEGSWQTEDNVLSLESSKHPGVAFNTYCFDAWNGGAQCGIKVSESDSEDYAGICFRSFDRENLWYAVYEADSDSILLVKRHQNTETTVASYEDIGWERDTWYYIKVAFRYSRMLVYTSADGLEWTERIEYEPSGMSSPTWTFSALPGMLSGRMGYAGYGYTEGAGGGPGPEPPDPPDPPPPEPPDPDPPALGQTIVMGTIGQRIPDEDYLPAGAGVVYGIWGEWEWNTYNSGFEFTPVIEDLYVASDGRMMACIARTGDIDPYYNEVWVTEDWQAGEPWTRVLSWTQSRNIVNQTIGSNYQVLWTDINRVVITPDGTIVVAIRYESNEEGNVLDRDVYTRLAHSPDLGNTWLVGRRPSRPMLGIESRSLQVYGIRSPINDTGPYPLTGTLCWNGSIICLAGFMPANLTTGRYHRANSYDYGMTFDNENTESINRSVIPAWAGGWSFVTSDGEVNGCAKPIENETGSIVGASAPNGDVTYLEGGAPFVGSPLATIGDGWELPTRPQSAIQLPDGRIAYVRVNVSEKLSTLRVLDGPYEDYWYYEAHTLPDPFDLYWERIAGSCMVDGGSEIDSGHIYRVLLANPDNADSIAAFRTPLKSDSEAHLEDDSTHIVRVTYNLLGVESTYKAPRPGLKPPRYSVYDDCDWEDANSEQLYDMGVGGVTRAFCVDVG